MVRSTGKLDICQSMWCDQFIELILWLFVYCHVSYSVVCLSHVMSPPKKAIWYTHFSFMHCISSDFPLSSTTSKSFFEQWTNSLSGWLMVETHWFKRAHTHVWVYQFNGIEKCPLTPTIIMIYEWSGIDYVNMANNFHEIVRRKKPLRAQQRVCVVILNQLHEWFRPLCCCVEQISILPL